MDAKFWTPKPCPHDFPPKLKKYWNSLQYSSTPIQCGWIQYYHDKEMEKKRLLAKTKGN